MSGKYDIVYMVKDCSPNEELKYSLRSIEKNWGPHGDLWIFGGCPNGLNPDHFVPIKMDQPGKWENTHMMMHKICKCPYVSEDFWFFNDDFFVMKPTNEDMPQQYNNTLQEIIDVVEDYSGGQVTYWTEQLRILVDVFTKNPQDFGTDFINYESHRPKLFNRKKMLAVMDKYPDVLFMQSLYGNYYKIGGENTGDVLINDPKQNIKWVKKWDPMFVSTTEEAFAEGEIGNYIRERFPYPSRWEAV